MAKKKQKRIRLFKVRQDFNGLLFVRFGGKYLSRELGLNSGDKLELLHQDNQIIFRKLSNEETALYEERQQEKLQKALLKKLFPRHHQQATALMVAENRGAYTIDAELLRQHEKQLQHLNT